MLRSSAGRQTLAAFAAFGLVACDMRTEDQRTDAAAGRPMQISAPQHVATSGPFEVYRIRVPREDGSKELWVVPGASATYGCGKNCVETVASPSPALAGLARLAPEERAALGLPPAGDARITGLSKLSQAEKAALGLEALERELLSRR